MAWVYEALFDTTSSPSYSAGDLNGQNSWSAPTNFDVQSTTTYQGNGAVADISSAGGSATVAITAQSSGTVYYAMRRSSTTGDASMYFKNSSTLQFNVNFEIAKIRTNNGASVAVILDPYVANTWYVIEVIFDASNNHTIRYNTGSGWSASFGPYTSTNTADIDTVELNSGGSNSQYWDMITPTNPFSTTSIKTINGLAIANVKTINGLAIANVKTFNGLA